MSLSTDTHPSRCSQMFQMHRHSAEESLVKRAFNHPGAPSCFFPLVAPTSNSLHLPSSPLLVEGCRSPSRRRLPPLGSSSKVHQAFDVLCPWRSTCFFPALCDQPIYKTLHKMVILFVDLSVARPCPQQRWRIWCIKIHLVCSQLPPRTPTLDL